MNKEDKETLFESLKELLDEPVINFGGDYFEHFNTDENIDNIISKLNEKFEIKLREQD